jgi:WD40 repeat protein/serine/threonine protein kinase
MDPSSPQRETVDRLAEEFVARYRRGERPALTEYTDRYPEHAEQIRDLFPALVLMEQIAPDGDSSAGSPPRPSAREPPGAHPEQLGDFRILREVGRGGMGVVYEAEQVSLGRHVALKVLPPELLSNARMRQRFEREARAAAKLHHSNIVPVFAVGVHGRTPFFAMQFIQGLGLDAVIEELERMHALGSDSRPAGPPDRPAGGSRADVSAPDVARSLLSGQFPAPAPAGTSAGAGASKSSSPSDSLTLSSSAALPGQGSGAREPQAKRLTYWQSVARVGVQVADALEYAHKQGIRHRDIKPSNLLLDTQGTVWVTDFGLAKSDDQENLTHTGDVLGTLRYLPPEAFAGRSDARSDVYALGLTLYELLALAPAFEERDRNRLMCQVTAGQPVRLGKRNPEVPRDLETIVHKAIDREPGGRYQTAGDLAADLERFLRDEPIRARRISLFERLARWARHHKGVAAALAVIAALLVAVTVASSIAAVQFRNLAAEADDQRRKAEQAAEAERWERYRANIAAAASALQLQNIGPARRALEEVPEEYRTNWEWRHFHSQLEDGASAVLRGHEGVVWVACFSAGRTRVLSSSADGTVRFWDRATGQELRVLRQPEGFGYDVLMQAIPQVIAGGDGPGLRFLDLRTGEVGPLALSLSGPVRGLAVSPDDRFIAFSYRADRTVHLFDRASGRTLDLAGHTLPVLGSIFSPDGKLLASTASDRTIRLWEAATGRPAGVMRGHRVNVQRLAFSPDGRRLASGSRYDENAVRLWDVATARELVPPLTGHRNEILGLAFSPDGLRVASASRDQTARLWDAASGKLIKELLGHTGDVNHVAFSPDGTRLATTSADQTLRLWDGTTGELLAVLRGHTGAVFEAEFSPDGKLIASASVDRTARLWDVELAERHGVLRGHTSFVYDVAFSPDGRQVASAAWDGTVRVWDPTTGRATRAWRHGHNLVVAVAFGPDGRRLASVARDNRVCLWDASGTLLRALTLPTEQTLKQVRPAWNLQGTLLACGGTDGPVRLWDPDTGDPAGELRGHEGTVCDVAFSPDGGQLASAGADRTVRLWDLATRRQVAVLTGHGDVVRHVTYSPDGRLLASASLDGTVRLWDARTHRPLAELPHGGAVHGAAFSPDGTRLATACHDNVIRLWDVATRQQVAELRGHTDYVHAVAFSPDGTRLVSGSGDFTVRVWDTLSAQERARLARDAGAADRGRETR